MDVGGTTQTATPTYDGEMLNGTQRTKLTAVPYAFRAGELAKTSGSFTSTLSFATPTANRTITIPDGAAATDTVCLLTLANCGGGAGAYIQNTTSVQTTANFNIQAANSGANGTVGGVIRGAAAGQTVDLFQLQNTAGNVLTKFNANGDLIIGGTNASNSANAFQVQNAAGASLLNVSSSTGTISVGLPASGNIFRINDISGAAAFSVTATSSTIINDNLTTNSPTGTLLNSATYVAGQYVQLTSNVNSQQGQLRYSNITNDSFDAQFEFYAGGGSGADATYLFAYDTSTPASYTSTAGGYAFFFDEYNSRIGITYNGTTLTTVTGVNNIGNSTWHAARIVKSGTSLKIYFDGVLKIDFTDTARTIPGTNYFSRAEWWSK
jgi:hypothetical protein